MNCSVCGKIRVDNYNPDIDNETFGNSPYEDKCQCVRTPEKEQKELTIKRKKVKSYFEQEFSFNKPKNKINGRWEEK